MLRQFNKTLGGCSNVLSNINRCVHYIPRIQDIDFTMYDVLKYDEHYAKMAPDLDRETSVSLLEECGKFCESELAPLYEIGDTVGAKHDGVSLDVTTPPGWKQAYKSYAEAGWQGLSVPLEYGGQGLPTSLGLIKAELLGTANWAWSMYPGLTIGAINTLTHFGSEEQKKKYVTKMAEGVWSGVMCLTEAQCGTDLGQVKTVAKPVAGTTDQYKITGQKIFISCGESDMTENIVHIVLARLPNSPEGTRGISLFLVPKYLDGEDTKNVTCGSIENKMGIHGSATCVMNFDGSTGYLIGEPNQGLKQMFTFMNTARLGTAVQGVGAAELSYLNSVNYAKERTSMRSLSGTKYPDEVADPIIVHPDVRRMLLTQRAIAEGGRAMVYDACKIADRWIAADTKADIKKLESELGLYTPILKGFLTELGLEAASHGMQIYGGHGYVKDYPMEQIYRDARISTVYEGTTGVQALDLLGRKVLINKGKDLRKFTGRILGDCKDILMSSPHRSDLFSMVAKTTKLSIKWNTLAGSLMVRAVANKDAVGAASVDFLMFSGYASMSYYMLLSAEAAHKKLANLPADGDRAFYEQKIQTAEFFFEHMAPKAQSHAALCKASVSALMQQKDEDFNVDVK